MEPASFNPGPWRDNPGFRSASADYDRFAKRAYDEAQSTGKTQEDFLAKKLIARCKRPLSVAVDTTGSMGKAPGIIFGKCPFLSFAAKIFLGEDLEISVSSIGDASSIGSDKEDYPVQARPFVECTEARLKAAFKELAPEGKGGGTSQESYELNALYYARQVEFPAGAKPIHIIIGDEQPYDFIDPSQAKKHTFIDLAKPIPTSEVFKELQEKYSVYLIRRKYRDTNYDSRIYESWIRLLGRGRIAYLLDDERVVDIIFGILGKESDQEDLFWKDLDQRQTTEQIAIVERCLRPVMVRPNRVASENASSAPMSRPLI